MARAAKTAGGTAGAARARAPLPAALPGPLPDRHPQPDFFLCDILDALPKGDLGTMEHPVFSLSTRPDRRILRYARNGVTIEVTPSVKGLATIHDKDVLIYCISQLVAALNAGRPAGQVLRLVARDLLVATNRETSGDGYTRLAQAFERLAGTRITTNLATGGVEITRGFGLIEHWEIVRKARGGRMISVEVKLSDWLYRAVLARSVLTLSRDYFRLRRPLERRLYELARKHCGRQPEWRVSVAVLHQKSGSASPRRVFRAMLREVIAADPLPDYTLTEEPGDIVHVGARAALPGAGPELPPLAEAVLDEARALAPGADVHALEAEWRGYWRRAGRARLQSPGRAFLGWVARRREG
ncbi:MAG: replication initiator protein A [Rhodobacteraceae bacterium]|nr:replication initiator protein A [Paracoccaceae bacterium]